MCVYFITFPCIACIFGLSLFLESWTQLWQLCLPVGSILHNRAFCLPLPVNYLPFTSSFRHILCVGPPTWIQQGHTLNGSLWSSVVSFTLSVSLCLLSHSAVCWTHLLQSELTQVCYLLPPCRTHTHTLWCTRINTITIVPISCWCCHHEAAGWDMV